jgi:hypothetical protein
MQPKHRESVGIPSGLNTPLNVTYAFLNCCRAWKALSLRDFLPRSLGISESLLDGSLNADANSEELLLLEYHPKAGVARRFG